MANIQSFANRETRMWEISKNLQMAELTQLERSDQIAEWVKLCDEEREKVSSQLETKPEGGSPEEGKRTAARELGLDNDEANRSAKLATITPEAKEAAIDVGIDNNESKL